jgi:hypothetical protein
MTLADKLTESLRRNGDLELASPNLQQTKYVLDLYMLAQTTSPFQVKTWTKTAIRSWILLHIVLNLPSPSCYSFVFDPSLIFVNLISCLPSPKPNAVRVIPRI